MNEIANSTMGMASVGLTITLTVIGLVAWFFVNRASVKATQQVRLLEAVLEEQKRQTRLLCRLTDSVAGKDPAGSNDKQNRDFTHLIPER